MSITLQVQYGQSVSNVTLSSSSTVGQLKQALLRNWPALGNTRYVLTWWGSDLVDDNLSISSVGMATADYVAIRYVYISPLSYFANCLEFEWYLLS